MLVPVLQKNFPEERAARAQDHFVRAELLVALASQRHVGEVAKVARGEGALLHAPAAAQRRHTLGQEGGGAIGLCRLRLAALRGAWKDSWPIFPI